MFVLLLSFGCSKPAPPAAPTSRPATEIVLVRHAEKVRDDSRDPALTPAGEARATCLAEHLESFVPDRLLATQYQRTQATLAPLAAATRKTVETIEAGDEQRWHAVLRTLPPGSRIVVAGHSNTVPALVSALGGSLKGLDADGYIPDDTFDRLIRVRLTEGEPVTVTDVPYCTVASVE